MRAPNKSRSYYYITYKNAVQVHGYKYGVEMAVS